MLCSLKLRQCRSFDAKDIPAIVDHNIEVR